MKQMRVFGNVEEAQAALARLESSDSRATADLIAPGADDAEARLSAAEIGREEIASAVSHLAAGRALLVINAGLGDWMRLNDILGPNNAGESKAWAEDAGKGVISDDQPPARSPM